MLFKKTNIMIFLILILFLLIIFIFYNKNNTTNTTNTTNKNNDNFEVKPNNGNNISNNNNIRFATDNQIIDNKIKLVNKKDSLLQKMIRDDLEKDDKNVLTTLEHINDDKKEMVYSRDGADNDNKYKGYNNYVNLRTDSYAPITSIGKQLITAFDDLPVAS
jgi:hypothetical protein